MQPGPFSNKDSRLYNDIEKMLGELKMPKNPKNKKIKAALNRGADRALDDVTKHGEDVYKKLNRGDHEGAEESEGRSDKALKRFNKRTSAASNEEVEVEEGKLVDRIMRKRKQMKNKGTIPGSDGY